jgi:hypothetical protein
MGRPTDAPRRYGKGVNVETVAHRLGSKLVDSRLFYAKHVVRVHCPIAWPEGDRCLNCHQRFPCSTYGWAVEVLADAGWSAAAIEALDVRTGPWS